MKLENLTLSELKAHAYDQIIAIESAQNNPRFINMKIEKRNHHKEVTENPEMPVESPYPTE